MAMPWVAVTGFGPFFQVEENPSEAIARGLAQRPPAGVEVRAVVLPVTIEGSAQALDAWLAEQGEPGPVGLLSLGVHRGPEFRLERQARGVLTSVKPDNDGRLPEGVRLGADRSAALDVDGLAAVLDGVADEDVYVSDDAGGFICERVYHHVLGYAEARGVPGLFLHVPPLPPLDSGAKMQLLERQVASVQRLVAELVRRV